MFHPQAISFISTYKCNFLCKHCSVNADLNHNIFVSREIVNKVIEEAYNIPSIRLIVFTGGETTLFYEELVEYIKLVHEKGFLSRIVTNGWWGKDIEECERIIKEFVDAGLNEINISYDDFHVTDLDKFGGCQNIVNIIKICHKYALPVLLCDLHYNGIIAHKTSIQRLIAENNLEDFANVIVGNVMPFGRARENYDEDFFLPSSTELKCSQIGKYVTIFPNGDVSYCCGHAIFDDGKEFFVIGNIGEKGASLERIIDKLRKNKLVAFLKFVGPEILLRNLSGKEMVYNNCEACLYLSKEYRDILEDRYSKDKRLLEIDFDKVREVKKSDINPLIPLFWI